MVFKLPHIPLAEDLIDIAFRSGAKEAKKVRGKGKLVPNKLLSSEIKRVEQISGIILGDLGAIVKYFPRYEELDEFLQMLLDLRVKKDRYKKSLGTVDWCCDRITSLRNKTLRKIKSKKDPEESKVFLGRASSFVKRISKDLKYLIEVKKVLMEFPIVKDTPTLVVAGLPNAGKSTFCRTLTGSKIKVAPYPFTTVNILIGYKKVRHTSYQIVDSPGILDRPMDERNTVELQAVLALKYLANKVLFIIDEQQELAPQKKLLIEIQKMFEDKVHVAINNKWDAKNTEYPIFNAMEVEDCEKLFRKCFDLE